MKLRTIALCLILSLIFVQIAQAAPLKYHSRPSRHGAHRSRRYNRSNRYPSYYRHNYWRNRNYYSWRGSNSAIAGGIGLLLGVLIANSNSDNVQARLTEKEDFEKKTQFIRSICEDIVESETKHVLELISRDGLPKTIEYLQQYWNDLGGVFLLDDAPTTAILSVSGLSEDVKLKYTFIKSLKEVTVSALSSEFQVAEEKKAIYQEPEITSSIKKLTGFELSNKTRDSDGYLTVEVVEFASPAYMAGMQQSDSIVKVDTYDAKNFDAENIAAYIENRAKVSAVLKVTFSRNGHLQTVALQL